MNILCITDISLYRAYLTKYFLSRDIQYRFLPLDIKNIVSVLANNEFNILLLQAQYLDFSYKEVINQLQDAGTSLNIPIVTLHAQSTSLSRLPENNEVIHVDRKSLVKALDDFKQRFEEQTTRSFPEKRRVLFADTSRTLHNVVKSALGHGFEVLYASDGMSAYQLFQENKINLILTGVHLPKMSGLELCRKIKEEAAGNYHPVIVLSSNDDPMAVDTAFNYGADDYLVKSFSPEMLADKVSEHLDAVERKRSHKVLVVDDSKLSRELIRNALLKVGLNVLTANDGQQGLAVALTEVPDIIITDIEMPVQNGYELCENIRSHPELEHSFILMMSSRNNPSDMKRAERLDVRRYFVKPFDVEKLQLVVEQLLAEGDRQYKLEYGYALESMKSLVAALEARDRYTQGHSARVCELSMRLARHVGLDNKALADLEIAANLHDIGKIGVRDAVLLKPDKLSDDEYALIQRHAIIGAEILKPIRSLKAIIPLIMLHHERWDGKGYPTFLSGEDIPLGARIIAIADAFDAMTSDRPYRKGMPISKALEIIEKEAGRQFCPFLGSKFIELISMLDTSMSFSDSTSTILTTT
ncbi:response regulator [Desulfovibrio inopinatus]|uniref:response regulator n=1 Tax=Desulfovibrio inopinatus TaxID=102109 RepID=UPI0004197D49|nr:response regulator [Desulfovibrio inopinatus]